MGNSHDVANDMLKEGAKIGRNEKFVCDRAGDDETKAIFGQIVIDQVSKALITHTMHPKIA